MHAIPLGWRGFTGAVDSVLAHLWIWVYDTAYGTSSWLERLASAFTDRLPTPFGVEPYAVHVDVADLVAAAEVAGADGEGVIFGCDEGNTRAAIRRMAAEEREGEIYGP